LLGLYSGNTSEEIYWEYYISNDCGTPRGDVRQGGETQVSNARGRLPRAEAAHYSG